MTSGANFHVDIALVGRARAKAIAARAHDANFVISGMNGCFHGLLTSIPNLLANHSILTEARRIQQMELASVDSPAAHLKSLSFPVFFVPLTSDVH